MDPTNITFNVDFNTILPPKPIQSPIEIIPPGVETYNSNILHYARQTTPGPCYGPTDEALRYGIRLRLPVLKDELQMKILNERNVYLDKLSIVKSKSPKSFGTLRLVFGGPYLSKTGFMNYDVELSTNSPPKWLPLAPPRRYSSDRKSKDVLDKEWHDLHYRYIYPTQTYLLEWSLTNIPQFIVRSHQ
jgi:hypothetical protein